MKWEGSRLKELANNKSISIQEIGKRVGVSRQTVNDWIGGQVPRGNHLLSLCRLFGINPGVLFADDFQNAISVPIHRQKMNSKITASTQKAALELSKEYLSIFKNCQRPEVVPVIRTQRNKDQTDVRQIAEKLRSWTGIPDDKPFDYGYTFKLAQTLGIHVIFRYFPGSIKSYAFYVKIHGHRVVFVNNATNILDLIFPLLHESVHAVRDEISSEGGYDEEEEAFCDSVAGCVQFPKSYVDLVYGAIRRLNKPQQVITLKSFAATYGHSLYGIVKAIEMLNPSFKLPVGGADSNLRKRFCTIGEEISSEKDVRKFLSSMHSLSPNFFNVVASQIDSISNRKLAEVLGLDSELDAGEIKAELQRSIASSQN